MSQANDLLASIHASSLPAGPVRLNSGEVILDLPKLLRTTSGYLAGCKQGSPAHQAYMGRLKKVKLIVDEIRELELQPVGVTPGAGERRGQDEDHRGAGGLQQSLF